MIISDVVTCNDVHLLYYILVSFIDSFVIFYKACFDVSITCLCVSMF